METLRQFNITSSQKPHYKQTKKTRIKWKIVKQNKQEEIDIRIIKLIYTLEKFRGITKF